MRRKAESARRERANEVLAACGSELRYVRGLRTRRCGLPSPSSRGLNESDPLAVEPKAARGAVVPLDQRLKLVGVVNGSTLRDARPSALDAVADARDDHRRPLPRGTLIHYLVKTPPKLNPFGLLPEAIRRADGPAAQAGYDGGRVGTCVRVRYG